MIRKDFILTREPTVATIQIKDYAGETVHVWQADHWNRNHFKIGEFTDPIIIVSNLEPEGSYKFYVRVTDLGLSLRIIEDHSEEAPPWYLVEAVGDSQFSRVNVNYTPSWGSDFTAEYIEVSNLQLSAAIEKYSMRA